MSKLLEFTRYIKDREYAVEDIEGFSELVQAITHDDGSRGYRLKPLEQADKISQKSSILIQYTWHCRDYVRKILIEKGMTQADAGHALNSYIEASRELQVISYLANEYKHAGVNETQRWATEIAPRLGQPFVRGVLTSFPFYMKPTIILWGESIPGFEFVGSAGVGERTFTFRDFDWIFSCDVLDKNGTPLGNAFAMCETAFEVWLSVLKDFGVRV